MQSSITKDIRAAADLLGKGEVVAIPTETVYGLAANALDADAVVKIFEVKNRPHFDPLIVHVASAEKAKALVEYFPEVAKKLAEKCWPGPLTLVLKRRNIIPDLVTSGLDTVGIRVPSHPLTLQLLNLLDFPLAAPSANPFGYISPTSPQHVMSQLGEKIPMILDGGNCDVGVESTIVDCTAKVPVVLRLGGTSIETIEALIGKVEVNIASSSAPHAPGMLVSHYAPRKKMLLGDLDELVAEYSHKKIGILSFSKVFLSSENIVLSASGNTSEAAQKLFAAMRELDESDVEIILAELLPEEGLGRAVNDRLRRAAYKD